MIPLAATTRVATAASSPSVARLASLTAQLARPASSQQTSTAAMSSSAAQREKGSSSTGEPTMPRFEKTPVPANPLGPGNYVKTAACLIIGDEVLNGKTKDSNSNYFAKWCFNLGEWIACMRACDRG